MILVNQLPVLLIDGMKVKYWSRNLKTLGRMALKNEPVYGKIDRMKFRFTFKEFENG
ncbi:hypothetical protein [uncultured Roseivirga sp.]|uniref:hypothetical protein n=1 Tax=uncultured Roseivirga sp. TaxID=543088 RepID=UPI0030D6D299|tara:strand:+ start:7294 stop:7464 length:171 start_codon:yes stop_codon:yes gene_type:complete